MFLAPWKKKKVYNYLRCFLALGSKKRGIYNVLWTVPSRNTSNIYAVFSMLQEEVFPCKSCKIALNIFKPEFTRSRSFTRPNYDVVDMMIEVMM